MSSCKYRALILSALLILFTVGIIFAGTTGKIAGKIVDKSTGEPLVGVNVVVKGTSLGAITDIEGFYSILLVPPGTQTVVASMVGHSTVIVNEVRVRIDETSPIDIKLAEEEIKMADIVVVAARNIIRKDVSTSELSMQQDDMKSLPVTSLSDVITLQAGVEEGLKVRGGDANQLLFQLDGVAIRDPRNNKPMGTVAMSSIQEISIERGGFNAEYGQVRSGIINVVTKEGDPAHYFGGATIKMAPPQQKYFGMSVFDPNSTWNRPYLDPAVSWTGTNNGAWNKYTQAQYPFFEGWNAVSQALLKDGDPTNDLTPAACQRVWEWTHRRRPPTDSPDYTIDGSFGGPVPFVGGELGNLRFFASLWVNREMLLIPLSRPDYLEYNGSIKLNSDLGQSTSLMITARSGESHNVAINADDRQFYNSSFGITGVAFWNATDYVRTPLDIAEITNEQRASRIFDDTWYSEADVRDLTLSAKLTRSISASSIYEISVENVSRRYLTGPSYVRDTVTKFEVVPGYFVDEAPFGWDPIPSNDLAGMFLGGHNATARDSSRLNSLKVKADLTSQLTQEHLFKTGVEFTYYNLNLNYAQDDEFFHDVNAVKELWNPYRLSFYAQDKIEAYGFIANLGLRLDLSNPNTTWVNVDPFNTSYFSTSFTDTTKYPEQKAKIDVTLSPRLGISHPITEDSKLYFNYGQFKEFPAYEEIFRVGRSSAGNMRNYGDPSLQQAKTISYELGYEQSLFDTYLMQIAAFYNDISNEQNFTQYLDSENGIGYYLANNNGYEDIRGLELTLRKSHGDWVRGFLTYTYQVTTQGLFGRQTINADPSQQIIIDQTTTNYYQSRPIPQPRANASITLFSPNVVGTRLTDLLLGAWNLNIIGTWKSGEWITYNPHGQINVANNVQTTDNYACNLSINKTVDLSFASVTLIIDMRNVFNIKRLSGKSFYDVYDYQDYMNSLHLPQNSAYTNIPGSDRAGDVRKEGVAYQPIEQSNNVFGKNASDIDPSVIYYNAPTRQYMSNVNGTWSVVPQNRMQEVMNDKAYIDMPNNSSFDFLNPRQVFFGINFSFKI